MCQAFLNTLQSWKGEALKAGGALLLGTVKSIVQMRLGEHWVRLKLYCSSPGSRCRNLYHQNKFLRILEETVAGSSTYPKLLFRLCARFFLVSWYVPILRTPITCLITQGRGRIAAVQVLSVFTLGQAPKLGWLLHNAGLPGAWTTRWFRDCGAG